MANDIQGKKQVDEITASFNKLLPSIEKNVTQLEKLNKEAAKLPSVLLKNMQDVANAQKKTNDATEKTIATQKKLTAEQKETKRIEDAILRTQAKLNKSTTEAAKTYGRLNEKLKEVNKESRKQARIELGLSSIYDKLVAKMNLAAKSVQNLTAKKAQGIQLSNKEQKELAQSTLSFRKYQRAVLSADASVGKFQRNVGNYPKGLRAAAAATRSLTSALGLMGGAFLIVSVVRKAISVMRDFEKANATLSGVLQIAKDRMGLLKFEAQRLGSITVKTATEVTNLQIAFARLGFTQSEIIDLTEATISGSIAMNSELSETANLVGAIVNTFDDLKTIDAAGIIDILALSTAKSALNFDKLQKGIPIVAGAANAAGVSFTRLIALMGKLADSGIDVSSSTTAIRNIFIDSKKKGLDYIEILETIKNSTDKLTASNDEFGRKTAVSASVLANNIDKVIELEAVLNDAANTARRMAEKELDTLDGAIKLLTSSQEGFILSLDDGSSALGRFIKTGLKIATESFNKMGLIVRSDITMFDRWKISINGVSRGLSFLNPFLDDGIGLFQESTDALLEETRARDFNVLAIKEQIRAFVELHGSLAPLIEDSRLLLEILGAGVDETKQEEAQKRNVSFLRSLIKLQNEQLLLQTNRQGAKVIQDRIRILKKEIDAILGVKEALTERDKISTDVLKDYREELVKIKNTVKKFDEIFPDISNIKIPELTQQIIDLQQAFEGEQGIQHIRDNFMFTDSQMDLISEQFDALGDLYGVDGSKFTALFDQKKNDINDFVAAGVEASKALFSAFAHDYEADLEKVRAVADLRLQFEGNTAEAREEIQRQLAGREAEIKRKQAKADKDQALFNILLNTARGITAALTSTPPNVPLSIIIGGIGLAQFASVASTEIPAFKDGVRDFDGGYAVVGDGGVSEIIRTPDGKTFKTPSTDTVVNLPEGTDVFKNENEFQKELDFILNNNNILPEKRLMPNIVINSGLSDEVYKKGVADIKKAIGSNRGGSINFDERGYTKYLNNQSGRTKILNNRFRIKGKNV